MSDKTMHNWDVFLKGNDYPQRILQSTPPQTTNDGAFILFVGDDGETKALYPTNAVSGVGRVSEPVGTYPIDLDPNGTFLRNVKTDGTGHWAPYTGPLFGIKE